MKLFDAHCHLQFPQYQDDLPAVLERMQQLEMGAVVVGTDYETSRAGLELARQHDFLWASVGLHPNDEDRFDISKYESLARDQKVVAVGECGLDYFRSAPETAAAQKEKFEAHIELAKKLNKPLIVHCRPSVAKAVEGKNAHDDCSSILQKTRIVEKVPVIIHFFTGSVELAQKYLDLGCHLSFPGPVTFTDMYDESIRATPLEKMLIETDAPFAAPTPYRGKRNEPSYVQEVAKKIAVVKGISLAGVAHQTVLNSQRIFALAK
jgi:TatD DNase family protein